LPEVLQGGFGIYLRQSKIFMMRKLVLLLGLISSFQLQAATLKLLTWNLFMIPKPINFSLQQTRAPLIAEALLNRDNDVLVFQETFSGSARRKIMKNLKQKEENMQDNIEKEIERKK
jgi:hypothetical protein